MGIKKPSAAKVINQYLAWRRKPDVGCRFAIMMAGHRDQYGQKMAVISGRDPDVLADKIEARVDELVADDSAAAATLLCPEVDEQTLLVRIAIALGKKPRWQLTQRVLPNTPGGAMLAFGLIRQIPGPKGVGTLPSEALVLGPFPFFPNTRRAPMTALELFVGIPCELDPKTRRPSTKANVAHVRMNLDPQKAFDRTWENSRKARRRSLNLPPEDPTNPENSEDDLRAKAKVAFVIPLDAAKALGCEV